MNAEVPALDVLIAQGAAFTYTQSRTVEEGYHSFGLQFRKSGNEGFSFLLRWNKRKICVKLAHWQLGVIPLSVKDKDVEKAQLRYGAVDCPVRKVARVLELNDKPAHVAVGDLRWKFVDAGNIIKISTYVGAVGLDGMIRQATEFYHLSVTI